AALLRHAGGNVPRVRFPPPPLPLATRSGGVRSSWNGIGDDARRRPTRARGWGALPISTGNPRGPDRLDGPPCCTSATRRVAANEGPRSRDGRSDIGRRLGLG